MSKHLKEWLIKEQAAMLGGGRGGEGLTGASFEYSDSNSTDKENFDKIISKLNDAQKGTATVIANIYSMRNINISITINFNMDNRTLYEQQFKQNNYRNNFYKTFHYPCGESINIESNSKIKKR